MASKDPAALFYIDTWLSATAEMDSDVRGWYLNLILHQYDKKDLPADIEKLAVLAGVKHSEFERFKQVFKQVLEQKFTQNEAGRLENGFAKTIISNREAFKDKRSRSGKIGSILKLVYSDKAWSKKNIQLLRDYLFSLSNEDIDLLKDKQMLEQMLKHLLKLYINGNENENIIKNKLKDIIEDNIEITEEDSKEDVIQKNKLTLVEQFYLDFDQIEFKDQSRRDAFLVICKQVEEHLESIQVLEQKLTSSQLYKLVEQYDKNKVLEKIASAANYKKYKTEYVSVYRTLNNWLKRY